MLYKTVSSIYALSIFANFSLFAAPHNFHETGELCKRYVAESLAAALPDCDIILLQFRNDEFWRDDDPIPKFALDVFSFTKARVVDVLKCGENFKHSNGICYIYPPKEGYTDRLKKWSPRRGNETEHTIAVPPPYLPPVISGHEYVQLTFVRKTGFPKAAFLDTRSSYFPQISKDIQALSQPEFLKKYNLVECFSNLVYSVCTACAFQVDYSASQLPPVASPPAPPIEIRKRGIELRRKHCNLIHLSRTEVSEIVYLAYRLKGYKEGRAEYKAACVRNPQILKPVEKLQTEIGRMLAKELYPKGLVEFRDGEIK